MSTEKSLNLYELETELVEAVQAADENPDDAALKGVVALYLQGAIEKRDRMAQFLKHLEAQELFAKMEIDLLRDRQRMIGEKRERLKKWIVSVMESAGVKKLEGKTHTLSLRLNPSSVEILNPEAVPASFKTVRQEVVIDKRAIKQALEGGADVPGTDLKIGAQTLVVR